MMRYMHGETLYKKKLNEYKKMHTHIIVYGLSSMNPLTLSFIDIGSLCCLIILLWEGICH